MAMALPELQGLLLDMLSTDRPVDAAVVAAMQVLDWAGLMAMARQHRLLPMLHWRLTNQRAGLPVPGDVRDKLAAGFKRSGMRMLKMQRELLQVQQVMDGAGIPCIALKGAYLAYHAYPHPALRPMRDLDILVPESMALKAYTALQHHGFQRPRESLGDLDATMRTRNHLPELYSASGRVCIELHTRLSNPSGDNDGADLIDAKYLWGHSISHQVAGSRLNFLPPLELLSHLVEHAVYRHRFDNGPLVLSDIAYLLERHAIDWPLFWRCTGRSGHTRGAWLLLKMVERYFGTQPVEWSAGVPMDHGSTAGVIEAASLLTLRNLAGKRDILIERDVHKHSGMRGRLGVYLGRVFQPKREIAAIYPVSEHSRKIYLWYIIHLWRLLTVRLPAYLASRREARSVDEARHVLRLEQWLDEPAEEAGPAEH